MNRVAFVFSSAPHGTTSGREGLDALLAISALTEDIGVFFISDGIFQLLSGQQPEIVLSRDYISTFRVLPLYNIKTVWVCASSLRVRGLTKNAPMVLNTTIIDPDVLREEINSYDTVFNF